MLECRARCKLQRVSVSVYEFIKFAKINKLIFAQEKYFLTDYCENYRMSIKIYCFLD